MVLLIISEKILSEESRQAIDPYFYDILGQKEFKKYEDILLNRGEIINALIELRNYYDDSEKLLVYLLEKNKQYKIISRQQNKLSSENNNLRKILNDINDSEGDEINEVIGMYNELNKNEDISTLGLSPKLYSYLHSIGCKNLKQLLQLKVDELGCIKGIGPQKIKVIKTIQNKYLSSKIISKILNN